MNILFYVSKFFSWISRHQNHEASILRAQLSLKEEQHRAEIFAMEQQQTTSDAISAARTHELKTEMDSLKTQIAAIEQKQNFTAGDKEKPKKCTLYDVLHEKLNKK
jgi:hypothetical protein